MSDPNHRRRARSIPPPASAPSSSTPALLLARALDAERPRPRRRRGGRHDPRPRLHPRGHPGRLPLARSSPTTTPAAAAVDPPAGLARRPRPARLLARHRRLLQGPPAAPRGAPAPAGPRHRRPGRGRRPRGLAVPRPPRRPRRRLDGQHARHPREPGRVPPAPPAEAGLRLPDRPDRRPDLPWPPAASSTRRSAPARGSSPASTRCSAALHGRLRPGDILLADAYYSSFDEVMTLRRMGVDVVMRQTGNRRSDFRRGARLGREDHLVEWHRDRNRRPWMSREEFAALPRVMAMRELRVRVEQPGFRTRSFVVVTSLLDPEAFPRRELAALYRARWHAELDIRSYQADDEDGRAAVQDAGDGPQGVLGPPAGVRT